MKKSKGPARSKKGGANRKRDADKADKNRRRRRAAARTPTPRIKPLIDPPTLIPDIDLDLPDLDLGIPNLTPGPDDRVFGNLRIVGIVPRTTLINATTSDRKSRTEDVVVPVETQFVVPLLKGWLLAFGKGEFVDGVLNMGETRAQVYARGAVVVTLEQLSEPNDNGLHRIARVRVSALLQSGRKDREWFAVASWHLVLLAFA